MVLIPKKTNLTKELLDRHDVEHETFGPRIGMANSGNPCNRQTWYRFHWAVKRASVSPRIRRLFKLGELCEEIVVGDLERVGIKVSDRQKFLVGIAGHEVGYIDGLCKNVPEAPSAIHLLEIKTHNRKSFMDLVKKKKVEIAKPGHYNQCQTYMRGLQEAGVKCYRALYIGVCKDDSDIHVERIKFDPDHVREIKVKVVDVLSSDVPPDRAFDKSWYECKFCDFQEVCHYGGAMEMNCRTCVHSDIHEHGAWKCAKYDIELERDKQKIGCADHEMIAND